MRFFQLDLFSLFPKVRLRRRRRTRSSPLVPKARPLPAEDPRLRAVWDNLAREFFPDQAHLSGYTITWSRRPQKRVLATCFPTKLLVKVASELQEEQYQEWLPPLLYHEMCHAVLGIKRAPNGRKYVWHGAEFRALERRHPLTTALDHWIKTGGWAHAVRRDRGKRAAQKRLSHRGVASPRETVT